MDRLSSLRPFIDSTLNHRELADVILSAEEWNLLDNIISTLRPFNKYSTIIQSDEVTLVDFFRYWTLLRIKLAKASPTDSFSSRLLQATAQYESMLMDNPLMLAAMFLHPSNQRALQDKKQMAIDFLCDLYKKIKRVESNQTEPAVPDDHSEKQRDDSDEELEQYLAACACVEDIVNMPIVIEETINVKTLLERFSGFGMPPEMPILQFWENNKNSMPVLHKLATAIYSVPPTQASVERSFSALPLIITSRRTSLGNDSLQNMLLIRLNCDVICNE